VKASVAVVADVCLEPRTLCPPGGHLLVR